MCGHAGGDKTNYSNREAEFASPSLVHHAATIECIYIHWPPIHWRLCLSRHFCTAQVKAELGGHCFQSSNLRRNLLQQHYMPFCPPCLTRNMFEMYYFGCTRHWQGAPILIMDGAAATNDRVRISQVRQRLVSSCQVSVSSCPAQTQEAQYAQKKYSQSCIFKAHIITS